MKETVESILSEIYSVCDRDGTSEAQFLERDLVKIADRIKIAHQKKLEEIADEQDDETLVMQCATCRHYERKHHHCQYHDLLTNPSYVCVACWESKYSKRKGESK